MKNIRFLLICSIAVSCTTPSRITTTNIQNLASFESNSSIYALPQTRVLITTTAVRKIFTPGPYCQYAKRFLGIENVNSEPFTKWEILNIKVSAFSEPDPEFYYSVKQQGSDIMDQRLAELSKTGLIINPSIHGSFQLSGDEFFQSADGPEFTDLTVKPYFYDPDKKKQKNLLSDSSFTKAALMKKQLEPKKLDEKANEAAKFILKIRKRRFKLLSGQYQVAPQEGLALQTSVEELNKLEAEYLSLFIGKYQTDTIVRNNTITPVAGEKLQRYNVYRFSTETGFYTSGEDQGEPVVLEVENLNISEILKNMDLKSSSNTYSDMLLYRIPDRGLAKIVYGSYIVVESEISVYQFGALVPLYVKTQKHWLH
jgi:hypothetical protein